MSEQLDRIEQAVNSLTQENSKSSQRLERIEEMLTSLIGIVGATNNKIETLNAKIDATKDELKQDISNLRKDVEFSYQKNSMFELELDRLKRNQSEL